MDRTDGNVSVIHEKCPDAIMSSELLWEIARREAATPPSDVDKPLILYGAGSLGKMAKDYLDYTGMSFLYVVDANSAVYHNDPAWNGITVAGLNEVSKQDKKTAMLAVCISTIPYVPIYQTLTTQGWKHVVPFYDITEMYQDRHPLRNGWFAGNLNNEDVVEIEGILERWGDDISRAHHLQFLAWRCLREEWVFDGAPVETNNRYFISEIRSALHDSEIFLDVGAHHGEVSLRFAEIVQGQFQEICAIEPDLKNFAQLGVNFSRTFHNYKPESVRMLDYVITDQSSLCRFADGLGYASRIATLGKREVLSKSIDDIGVTPTFIKLHLEGDELTALKGGIKTIQLNRPIIAATGYHNRSGLWELPRWLMDSLPDYKFLLRLHGWCGTGMVVYALPKERLCNIRPFSD
jgi:FkbM family methyltransferase